tara:strand:+ start:14931 stop:16661 length:1731 start_codon:yes stop_codon:yes gene_type:complete
MAKQQTRTSGGAYQNPTEGIVDYGAFGRGIEKGIKPGIDFLNKKQKEEEDLNKKAKDIKLDTSFEVFEGINKNPMTGGYDLKSNPLLTDHATEVMTSIRDSYIVSFKNKDKQGMDNSIRKIANIKSTFNNLSEYIERIGDPGVNDSYVSNTNFINENGERVKFNSIDFTNLNNNSPNAIRQGSKADKYGKIKEGFYVTSGGEDIFLNTQDMDKAFLDRSFKLKDRLQDRINQSVAKGGVNSSFNRVPMLNTDTEKTVTIKKDNGETVTITGSDTRKYIDNDFYTAAETNAVMFAENTYSNADKSFFESGWNQFTKDTGFTLSKELQKEIGGRDYRDPKVATELDDNLKIRMMQDRAMELWKISNANRGYIKGSDGRAQEINLATWNYSKTTNTNPDPIEEPSEMQKSISLNIKNSLTGSATDVKNNLFSGDPIAVTFAPNVFAKISFKDLTSKPGSSALSSDLTGGKKLESLEFAIGNIEDAEGKSIDAKTVTYDFSLLDKTDVGKSGKFSLEHYLLDKYGKGYEAFVQKKINKEKQKRRIFFVNQWQENNKKGTYSEGAKAYEDSRKKQLAKLKN